MRRHIWLNEPTHSFGYSVLQLVSIMTITFMKCCLWNNLKTYSTKYFRLYFREPENYLSHILNLMRERKWRYQKSHEKSWHNVLLTYKSSKTRVLTMFAFIHKNPYDKKTKSFKYDFTTVFPIIFIKHSISTIVIIKWRSPIEV